MLIRHLFMDTEESEVSKYLKENYVKIFSIITIIMFLIIVFSVLGIDFSKSDESTLVDQYVVENFDSVYIENHYALEAGSAGIWGQKVTNFYNIDPKSKVTHILFRGNVRQEPGRQYIRCKYQFFPQTLCKSYFHRLTPLEDRCLIFYSCCQA